MASSVHKSRHVARPHPKSSPTRGQQKSLAHQQQERENQHYDRAQLLWKQILKKPADPKISYEPIDFLFILHLFKFWDQKERQVFFEHLKANPTALQTVWSLITEKDDQEDQQKISITNYMRANVRGKLRDAFERSPEFAREFLVLASTESAYQATLRDKIHIAIVAHGIANDPSQASLGLSPLLAALSDERITQNLALTETCSTVKVLKNIISKSKNIITNSEEHPITGAIANNDHLLKLVVRGPKLAPCLETAQNLLPYSKKNLASHLAEKAARKEALNAEEIHHISQKDSLRQQWQAGQNKWNVTCKVYNSFSWLLSKVTFGRVNIGRYLTAADRAILDPHHEIAPKLSAQVEISDTDLETEETTGSTADLLQQLTPASEPKANADSAPEGVITGSVDWVTPTPSKLKDHLLAPVPGSFEDKAKVAKLDKRHATVRRRQNPPLPDPPDECSAKELAHWKRKELAPWKRDAFQLKLMRETAAQTETPITGQWLDELEGYEAPKATI